MLVISTCGVIESTSTQVDPNRSQTWPPLMGTHHLCLARLFWTATTRAQDLPTTSNWTRDSAPYVFHCLRQIFLMALHLLSTFLLLCSVLICYKFETYFISLHHSIFSFSYKKIQQKKITNNLFKKILKISKLSYLH